MDARHAAFRPSVGCLSSLATALRYCSFEESSSGSQEDSLAVPKSSGFFLATCCFLFLPRTSSQSDGAPYRSRKAALDQEHGSDGGECCRGRC
jgi:hypothetical protein